MEIPTKEMWAEWLHNPVTQAFRHLLNRWREGNKEQWAQGNFRNHEDNLVAHAETVTLGRVLDIDYEEMEKGLSDEE